MARPMRRLIAFLTNMDARAIRAVLITFVLFGGVGTVLLLGASLFGLKSGASAQAWIGAGAHGPWALPVAVAAFTALAFLGAPQFVLIAAAVVAFGPWAGFIYSWIGNLVSAVLGFYVGRRVGARALRNFAGQGLRDFMDMVGRNGFWASLLVRLVPAAPFIVVNMAAGVTSMRFVDFLAGTAIGSTPKIALVAFAGEAMTQAVRTGGVGHWLSLGLAAAAWIAAGLAARAWIKRKERERAAQVSAAAPL